MDELFKDVAKNLFDIHDADNKFEEFEEAFNEYTKEFILNKKEMRSNMVLENMYLGLLNEEEKKVATLMMASVAIGSQELIKQSIELTREISALLKKHSLEAALLALTNLHVDHALLYKGVMSITRAQALKHIASKD